MEAARWSDAGDCLEPLELLAREVAKLANKVRQGSLGPGVSSLDLKTLYKQRKIDYATERLKTLFSVEYGREFAERTNRVLEQFRTAEFWAFKALELHPFGREGAGNRQKELQETYRREVGMAFQAVGFEPEREDLLERPELLAMFDALERYDKLVTRLNELKDYLIDVAGLVRKKTDEKTSPAPTQQDPIYLGDGKVKIGERTEKYTEQQQQFIEFLLDNSGRAETAQLEQLEMKASKVAKEITERHDCFLAAYLIRPGKHNKGKGYSTTLKDGRK